MFADQWLFLVGGWIATVIVVASSPDQHSHEKTKDPRQLHVDQTHSQPSMRRLLDNLASTALESDAYDHLVAISMTANGDPNPRLTCTENFKYAADYVYTIMSQLGMTPMGNTERTSFHYVVENSVDPEFCPHGIINTIGMIPGTLYPDEYVIYNAHLDGVRNNNPQTFLTRGMQDITNTYDDGLAVAVGLATAKQFNEAPPERSVIIMIDDAEENVQNVGEIPLGRTQEENCEFIRNSKWFNQVFDSVVNIPWRRGCDLGLMGASAWVKKPTIPLEQIKLVLAIDPLGSPFTNTTGILTAIGGEFTTYNQTGTLNNWLQENWPDDTAVRLAKVPRAGVPVLFSNQDAFGAQYRFFCGNSCVENGGVPSVWLAEASFQKYHSGQGAIVTKDLFGGLLGTNGTFPSPIYFSLDNMESFYRPGLADMATVLFEITRSAATGMSVNTLTYDKNREMRVERNDMINIIEVFTIILEDTERLPEAAATILQGLIDGTPTSFGLLDQAQLLATLDLTTPEFQANANLVAQAAVAIALSLDFFEDDYPGKEAFLDQTYLTGLPNSFANEPFPTAAPSVDVSAPSLVPSGGAKTKKIAAFVLITMPFLF